VEGAVEKMRRRFDGQTLYVRAHFGKSCTDRERKKHVRGEKRWRLAVSH